jgi:hypothetical protein
MFGRVKDFFYRHRRKFVITGVIVGGSCLCLGVLNLSQVITAAKKYAEYKLAEMEEQAMTQQFAKTRFDSPPLFLC